MKMSAGLKKKCSTATDLIYKAQEVKKRAAMTGILLKMNLISGQYCLASRRGSGKALLFFTKKK